MQLLVSRGLLINPTQEFQPLLVAMPIHAGADNFSIRDIECGEQRGRTVALIIVSPRFTSPFLHRKSWLGSIQSLNLALLIDGEDQGMLRWIQVSPHDIFQPLDELRIVAELER